jgi:1-acyl-sn-glycerol-3-phosphate acyltransferase
MFRKIFKSFYVFYAAVVFLIGLVITFILVLINSVSDTPAAYLRFHRILETWSRVTLWLVGMPVKVIDKPSIGRHILVANHISYIDAPNVFAAKPDPFHALGKMELAKVPLFGFLYRRAVILVDRSSPESRARSMHLMKSYLLEKGNVFIFPEGTFNETGGPLKDFHNGAVRLAIDAQIPIVPLIFPDALDRLHHHSWLSLNPGRNRAIYLDPVSVVGMTMDDVPKLKDQVHAIMENALIRYQAKEA